MFWYITDENKKPLAVNWDTYKAWHDAIPKEVRTGIGYTVKRDTVGSVCVSTVFLSSDHRYDENEPVLWETMIFGGDRNEDFVRYTSEADAIAGHNKIIKELKQEPLAWEAYVFAG